MSKPIRVVLVDDSPTIRTMLGALFSDVPEIDLCAMLENGHDAIDFVLSQRPDVVVMDMQMPIMDGLSAARAILEQWPEAKIIMNTAYADEALQSEAKSIGVAGYMTKDQRPTKLLRVLLDLGRSPEAARQEA